MLITDAIKFVRQELQNKGFVITQIDSNELIATKDVEHINRITKASKIVEGKATIRFKNSVSIGATSSQGVDALENEINPIIKSLAICDYVELKASQSSEKDYYYGAANEDSW